MAAPDEEEALRLVARQTSQSISHLRQRAEQELVQAKHALEARTNELAHSLAILRATFDTINEGILVVDENGVVTDFNEQFLSIWKVSREGLSGAQLMPLLARAALQLRDKETFFARAQEISSAVPAGTTGRLIFRDGRVVQCSSRLQSIGERIAGRVWSFHDITERVRAEEALQDEARILELLNDTGRAIAAQLDLRSVVQIVTDAATELTGAKFGAFFYTVQAEDGGALVLYALSGAPREAFEKFGHPRATDVFGPTFRGEGPVRADDILKDPRYGQWAPHHGMPQGHLPVRSYLAIPVIMTSGEVIGGLLFGHPEVGVFTERTERIVVGVAAQAAIAIDNARLYEAAQKEIAERKRAEAEREKLLVSEKEAREQAQRETRMKDEFLATLSHELRTPLNAILGWASLLRASARPADLNEGIAVIERNARAQAQIIEDLLDMSRIISGKVRLDVRPLDLASVIEAAIESVNPMAAAKQITIDVSLDETIGTITGDPARLQQVLWNLLTNALKFTPSGGRVEVSLHREQDRLCVRVRDTGPGISAAFLPMVFDRFRQADASTTRQHGGLGLGLAIVKNLVELHGGEVQAESEGENRGACFTVCLPLQAAEQETVAPHARSRVPVQPGGAVGYPDLHGINVLAVDDEADARYLVQRILSACGATVVTAGSTVEAIERLQTAPPHILITDIGMPGEDGYSLMRKVRALGPNKGGAIPAIALTAFARAEDRQQSLAHGFQMHMTKPVEGSELIAAVANLAGRSDTQLAHPEFQYD